MHLQRRPGRDRPKPAEIRAFWSSTTHVQHVPAEPRKQTRRQRCIMLLTGARTGQMRRTTRAKKRARAQRQALIKARCRRAQTAAARAAHSARTNPAIRAHDALVLPEIVRLRAAGLSWARIARELEQLVDPPGARADYPLGHWHASAAWRIARRHGLALQGAESAGIPRRGTHGRFPC